MIVDPAGSLQRNRIEQPSNAAEGRVVLLAPGAEPRAPVWQHYLKLIYRQRWQIAVCTILSMAITLVCTKFLMTHWYQAVTLLRPASQEPQSSFSLGTILSSAAGASSGPLGNIFGPTAQDAEELLAMLGSVDFNANLAERNKLGPVIMRHVPLSTRLMLAITGGSSQALSRWALFRLMQSRLDCAFDENTGNFTLKFIDPDPAQARRILTLYVDSLRGKLRDRAIASSAAAIKALQTAVSSTSDALMVGQLDQLAAQQLQQLGTAEVQADFAFVVIDPPMVPPTPYFPRPLIDTLAAGILTPFLMCAWLILRRQMRQLILFVRETVE